MSRRHHGGRPHRPSSHPRPQGPVRTSAPFEPLRPGSQPLPPRDEVDPRAPLPDAAAAAEDHAAAATDAGTDVIEPVREVARDANLASAPLRMAVPGGNGAVHPENGHHIVAAGCTAPQLRRFIKSRPYVPMHELRRRFGINGNEDDVTAVELASGRIFVGLPAREGGLLGELLRGGEVGYELSLDPRSPIVVGLYPMRPIPRS